MIHIKRVMISLVAATFCCTDIAEASPGQGGWRQWDVRLRDGRQLEASPLGAPNDGRLSLTVAAYGGRERSVARALVHVIAARPLPGESLPALPEATLCEDAIVRRDGTTTIGPVRLANVRWSEGIVVQRGDTVHLRDVAYVVFATRSPSNGSCRRETTRPQPPDMVNFGITYPVGIRQMQRWCGDDCQA